MTKPVKRGPGRPKKQPVSPEAMREQAVAGIRRTAKRQLQIEAPDIYKMREEVHSITHRNRFTKEEMDEMKKRIDVLYREFVTEVHEREAQENVELNERLRLAALKLDEQLPSSSTVTPEEWNAMHGLRADGSKKRGPAPKKKKMVHELAAGERGLADEPMEPVDIEQIEQQIMAEMYEAHIAQQKAEARFPKGKRIRDSEPALQRRSSAKSFWI